MKERREAGLHELTVARIGSEISLSFREVGKVARKRSLSLVKAR
jgi:hypothetical protein